ncbi:MAG: hypothetical protein WC071_07290 [Victivallaceae bacterium]
MPEKIKWYFSKTFIVIVFGCAGPLALPLIWWRPQTSRTWKIVLTIIIFVLTWFMYQATVKSVEEFNEIYKMLESQSL